jgi:hypothetical protein
MFNKQLQAATKAKEMVPRKSDSLILPFTKNRPRAFR